MEKKLSETIRKIKDLENTLSTLNNSRHQLEEIIREKISTDKQLELLKTKSEMLKQREQNFIKIDIKEENAMTFLKKNNIKFRKDDNVFDLANECKFTQLLLEQPKNYMLEDFSGKNCDDCEGWDGSSSRCQCGNRRVRWEYSGDFENMEIYGEAF